MITVDTRPANHPTSQPATKGPLLDERAAEELAATFAVLGDPTRVRLVDALAHGELCVSDLSAVVGLSESAVSHQLRLLRSLRIVRARRAGRQVYYQLDDSHIRTLLDRGGRRAAAGDGRAPRPGSGRRRRDDPAARPRVGASGPPRHVRADDGGRDRRGLDRR